MHVKLPEGRDYSGEEIVAAFKRAAVFEQSPRKRWGARETDLEVQYEAGSVHETIRKMGAWVQPQNISKRWVLWGEIVWRYDVMTDKRPGFILKPLLYQERHREIEVSISTGPSGNFGKAQSCFEAFLGRFFEELKIVPNSN